MIYFEVIFIVSVVLLFHVYVLYPFLLYVFSKVVADRIYESTGNNGKILSFVIPAYNEESVIAEKIRSILAIDYPREKMQLLVMSDGSTDQTIAVASKALENEFFMDVKIIDVKDRLGKTNIINKAMELAIGDYVVFSDANVFLDKGIGRAINEAFTSDSVGGVAGQLTYLNEGVTGTSENSGLYWRYEEFIKKHESLTGSMMGADGSIFAIRRALFRQLPLHVLDDFCTSMGVISQGYELKFDENIKAYEKSVESSSEEYSRKVRISNRSFNSFKYLSTEIFSGGLWNVFKFISHKLLRWFSFPLLMVVLVSSLCLSLNDRFYGGVLIAQLFCYAAAAIGSRFEFSGIVGKFTSVSYYFLMVNYAAFIGISRSIKGEKVVVWKKAETAR